ncbi:hypothetical protein TcasGA2_TC015398 [Tribolium castaneum]|uniref:Ionotropic glutamate receptor C-terminal domain-containing protein n=1 Tax=Tribolium castaneum TaxID=7070 RepID=D2A4P1_TRICA|nr:PREDICTED: uncharacterized protein LOC107398035 [Tribolium castaneum]EFA05247.1 hypothetical protein TcasGA2_TC015398 [Tribolium castaneum]|eukprot:XP_015836187.1 PREDICTED: uncharacterized protein LOC107398035 [Tribolium castaneum]
MKPNFQLLLLLLNNTINNCLEELDQISDKSVRLVLLQTVNDVTLSDHLDVITNRIGGTNSLQIEKKNLNDSGTTPDFGTTTTHVIVTRDASTLDLFLDTRPEIVVPLARHSYKIFFTWTSGTTAILRRFWADFGVLDVCFCGGGGTTCGGTNQRDLHRLPLKIAMFVRFPTVMTVVPELLRANPIYKSSGLVGLDGCLLSTLAGFLNFDFTTVGDMGHEDFGWVLPNGTVTGSLGQVAGNRAQIGTNGRFITNYGTTDIEFTVPYDSDKICVLVPKSQKVPQWLMVFTCFNAIAWACIYGTLVVCTIVWYRARGECRVFWEMFSVIHGIPVKIVPTVGQSIFLFFCMVFNVIILSLVQGSFFKSFTTPTYFREIDTLEELDRSGLPIASNFYSFDGVGSKTIANLKRRKVPSVPHIMDAVAYKRNVAKLERKRDIEAFIKTHYLDKDGTPLLHIVNECLTSYFISYIVPKGSALLAIFDHVILRIVESGLTLKWYQDVEYTEMLVKLQHLNQKKNLWEPFSLYSLQGAFFLWVLGTLLSVLGFLGEVLVVLVKKTAK